VGAPWRAWHRRQLKLAYTKLGRGIRNYVIQKSFVWNDRTYAGGMSASSTLGTYALSGYDQAHIYLC